MEYSEDEEEAWVNFLRQVIILMNAVRPEPPALPQQVICAECGDNWAPYYIPWRKKYFCSRYCAGLPPAA